MSNAIKMKKDGKKQNTTKISQSIPAQFYRNYIPPKSPKINPIQPPSIPDFEALPKISPSGKGINIQQSGSYSLKQNKHPMSMPVRHGMMGPTSTPFVVSKYNDTIKEENEEQKNEPNSLEEKNKGLKVGSFTCFEVMSSPLKHVPESADTKDNVSATSAQTASTFASGLDENEVAPEDDEDEEDGPFDIEL